MAHRLLSTIVLASGSLLACGGMVPDVGGDADPPKNDASTDGLSPVVDSGPDLRACEPGWPTTKGVVCSFDGGVKCCDVDGGKSCCAIGDQ